MTSAADWPVYHLNTQRTGNDPSFPTFTGSLAAGWSTALDGAVYAEPLVVHGTVIAATEGDSVYAINPGSGAILWRRNLGTPVPLSTLPCGDINPLGITGTPAYDYVTGSLFVVAEVTGFQHVLFALDPATGAVRWSRDVDLAGDDPRTHQQRPALAVANGYVYIGFGGLAGDCGQYVGEVVGVPASGQGGTISYRVPVTREGAVWATGGPVIDASGNVYVSVGNGASTGTYDGSDSVLELSPTLSLKSWFAPSNWATDNAGDADLGSLSPVLVPGGWVFIAGKSGTGYVLRQGSLGGIGGQVSSATVCTGFGGAAQNGSTIYVPCKSSLREVQVGANGSLTPGWQSSAAGGPPVLGGGVVWSVNTSTGRLLALDPATGATLGSIPVGAVPHFASPTLWQDQILVGTMAGVASVRVAATLAVSGLASPRTAGVAGSIAVTALDAGNNVVTGYRGKVHFTSSDPAATLPSDYTFTGADAGTHVFSVTLKTAGSQGIRARDTVTATITGAKYGIVVTPAAAKTLVVSGLASPRTAGVAGTVTVTARDAYGNVATGYTGTVTFTSTDSHAVLPANYKFTAANAGVHTFSVTLKTAGNESVRARDTVTSAITGGQYPIVVTAAAATTLTVSGLGSPRTHGTAGTITVTVRDAYGNVATGYRGTVTFTSTDSHALLPANYTFTAANAGVHTFSVTLKSVGTQAVRARDTVTTTITGLESGIVVT